MSDAAPAAIAASYAKRFSGWDETAVIDTRMRPAYILAVVEAAQRLYEWAERQPHAEGCAFDGVRTDPRLTRRACSCGRDEALGGWRNPNEEP